MVTPVLNGSQLLQLAHTKLSRLEIWVLSNLHYIASHVFGMGNSFHMVLPIFLSSWASQSTTRWTTKGHYWQLFHSPIKNLVTLERSKHPSRLTQNASHEQTKIPKSAPTQHGRQTGWWASTYTATFTLLSEALRSYISTQELLNLDSETLIYNF